MKNKIKISIYKWDKNRDTEGEEPDHYKDVDVNSFNLTDKETKSKVIEMLSKEDILLDKQLDNQLNEILDKDIDTEQMDIQVDYNTIVFFSISESP